MGRGDDAGSAERLRALPAVDRLAADLGGGAAATSAARAEVQARRAELLAGAAGDADLVARAQERMRGSLRRVVNATGVVVHTNLGRAPLPGGGYSNLEYDLVTGSRGSRHDHVEPLLCELTGAEAAIAVNNCAAAVLLAVAALAGPEREVVVSRGQLVEIGGSFRIPEVIAQSGARLVEVGTTNRTRLADYERALGPRTGCVLRAHPSNFRQLGFVEEVTIEALCELDVPVVDDVGSGALADGLELLASEPAVRRSVRAGAAIVCFSGDKLLGGPQAGLMVGRREAIDRARAHPLARAVRIDKLSLAALLDTLALHRDPERALREIPVLAMLTASEEELGARARRIADAVGDDAEVVRASGKVGGGALPLTELDGPVVAVDGGDELAAALRAGDPPVVARIADGRVLLDPRTMTDEEAEWAATALRAALRR